MSEIKDAVKKAIEDKIRQKDWESYIQRNKKYEDKIEKRFARLP